MSPVERGTLSAALGLRNILLAVADVGLSLTTIRVASAYTAKGMQDEAREIFRRALFTRIVMALMVCALTVAMAPLLAGFPLAIGNRTQVLWAMAAGLAGMTVAAWGSDVSQACRMFVYYIAHQVGEAVCKLLAVVLVFVVLAGSLLSARTLSVPSESVLWYMAGGATVAGLFSIFIQRRELARPVALSRENANRVHGELRGFNRYGGAIALLHTVNGAIDILMIQWLIGGGETAIFDGARRFAQILPLIGGVLTTVLLPRAAALDSVAACARYLKKALGASLILAVVSAGGLALAAGIIIPLFWGNKYANSIPALHWLCVAYGLTMLLNPLTVTFYPLKREGTVVALSAVNMVLFLALGARLIPEYGAVGAAYTTIAVKCVLVVLYATLLWPVFRNKGSNAVHSD